MAAPVAAAVDVFGAVVGCAVELRLLLTEVAAVVAEVVPVTVSSASALVNLVKMIPSESVTEDCVSHSAEFAACSP